jgi:hypothetical protein
VARETPRADAAGQSCTTKVSNDVLLVAAFFVFDEAASAGAAFNVRTSRARTKLRRKSVMRQNLVEEAGMNMARDG